MLLVSLPCTSMCSQRPHLIDASSRVNPYASPHPLSSGYRRSPKLLSPVSSLQCYRSWTYFDRGEPITRKNWSCQTHDRCLSSAGQSISDVALLPPRPPPLNSSCSLWMWNINCLSQLPSYPLPLLYKHPSSFKTQFSYVSIIPQFKKKKDSAQRVAHYLKLVLMLFPELIYPSFVPCQLLPQHLKCFNAQFVYSSAFSD